MKRTPVVGNLFATVILAENRRLKLVEPILVTLSPKKTKTAWDVVLNGELHFRCWCHITASEVRACAWGKIFPQFLHTIPTSLNTADTLLFPFGECLYSLKLSSIISYVPNKENLFSDQDLFHLVIMSLFAWSLFCLSDYFKREISW